MGGTSCTVFWGGGVRSPHVGSWDRLASRAAGGEKPLIRILVAEEQSLFLQAVRVALEEEEDFSVVGEVRTGLDAIAVAIRTRPDVALLASWLPRNFDSGKLTTLIKSQLPECKIVILADEEDQEVLISALDAGASGLVTKDSPLDRLIDGVRAAHAGEQVIPPGMMDGLLTLLLERRSGQQRALQRLDRLTARQRVVLAHLAEGASNDWIAERLVISPQTARTHIQNVLNSLGVHSRLEAAAFVINNQLLDELRESENRS
jgi:DNA-binding NarL/FixJ family response regulator